MGQEDHLKRQIDALAKALAKMLAKLTGSGSQGSDLEIVTQVNNSLKSELGLDLDALARLPDNLLINELIATYGLKNDHLNIVADIAYHSAKALQATDELKAKSLFAKAAMLYQYLANTEKNYSLAWQLKINEINKIIS